jgi:hypothetical protein
MTVTEIKDITNVVKDITNVGFFVIIAIIAFLTYRQAKKTVFAPFNVEIFKLHLEEMKSLLLFLSERNTTRAVDLFDYYNIAIINGFTAIDKYQDTFFSDDLAHNGLKAQEIYKSIVGVWMDPTTMSECAEYMNYATEFERELKDDKTPHDPALKLAHWGKYKHSSVHFTAHYKNSVNTIEKFANSPLLPEKIRASLHDLLNTLRDNLRILGGIITERAKEFPERFPTAEHVMKGNAIWLYNEFNRNMTNPDQAIEEILIKIKTYMKADALFGKIDHF